MKILAFFVVLALSGLVGCDQGCAPATGIDAAVTHDVSLVDDDVSTADAVDASQVVDAGMDH